MAEKIKRSGVPETMLQTIYARAKESQGRGAICDQKAESGFLKGVGHNAKRGKNMSIAASPMRSAYKSAGAKKALALPREEERILPDLRCG